MWQLTEVSSIFGLLIGQNKQLVCNGGLRGLAGVGVLLQAPRTCQPPGFRSPLCKPLFTQGQHRGGRRSRRRSMWTLGNCEGGFLKFYLRQRVDVFISVCLIVSNIMQKLLGQITRRLSGRMLCGSGKGPLNFGADPGICFHDVVRQGVSQKVIHVLTKTTQAHLGDTYLWVCALWCR